MHIEIQVALNFVISYLYNKLPRRRVNLFGEELEKALKDRFQGHWYPEKPFKVNWIYLSKIIIDNSMENGKLLERYWGQKFI